MNKKPPMKIIGVDKPNPGDIVIFPKINVTPEERNRLEQEAASKPKENDDD